MCYYPDPVVSDLPLLLVRSDIADYHFPEGFSTTATFYVFEGMRLKFVLFANFLSMIAICGG
jgi:hypothetical protein